MTKKVLNEKLIPLVCIAGPLLTVALDMLCNPAYYEKLLHVNLHLQDMSVSIFNGYKIGPELILINGTITFFGLWLIAKKSEEKIAL